jgi:hypothetical protein
MLTEAISFVTFIAQAVVFSTDDAVLSNIFSLPIFKAQFAFALGWPINIFSYCP